MKKQPWVLRIALLLAPLLIAFLAWFWPSGETRLSFLRFCVLVIAGSLALMVVPLLLCPKRYRRTFGMRWLTVSLSACLALFLVESAFLLWPASVVSDNPWYLSTGEALKRDSDLPWLRPPGIEWSGMSRGDLAMETNSEDPYATMVTFQTDHQGFRNAEHRDSAECLFVGDSFTEAGNLPIEKTFVRLIEERSGMSTRNLGVAGYGPPAELVVLEKFGIPCKPQVVIWQIAETNDLDDAMFFVQWQQAGRPNVLPGFKDASLSPRTDPQHRSPLRLFYDQLVPEIDQWPFRGVFTDRSGTEHGMRFELSFLPEADQHSGWPVIEYSITSGAKLLRDREIPLVVLLIPRKLRVMGGYCDFAPLQIETPDGPYRIEHDLPEGWELPQEVRLSAKLRELCDNLDVPFVDATDALIDQASRGALVYQPMDTHLTAEGHQVVAELLSEQMGQIDRVSSDPDPNAE